MFMQHFRPPSSMSSCPFNPVKGRPGIKGQIFVFVRGLTDCERHSLTLISFLATEYYASRRINYCLKCMICHAFQMEYGVIQKYKKSNVLIQDNQVISDYFLDALSMSPDSFSPHLHAVCMVTHAFTFYLSNKKDKISIFQCKSFNLKHGLTLLS